MFGGLIPLVIIGLIIFGVVRSRSRSASGSASSVSVPRNIEALLERWSAAGVLDSAAVERINQFELEQRSVSSQTLGPARQRRVPLVAEALGYLGGILGIVGLVMLIASYWDDMSDVIRLVVSAAGSAVAVTAGFFVPSRGEAALQRLQWFVWAVGTAAAGVVGGVIVHDLMGRDSSRQESQVALGVAIAVAVVSAGLWWRRERPVQQLTMIGGVAVAVGCGATQWWDNGPTGLAVWGFGLLVIVIGVISAVPMQVVSATAGTATLVIGAGMVFDDWQGAGSILMVVSSAGAVVVGSIWANVRHVAAAAGALVDRLRSGGPTGMVVVGAIGMMQAVPMAAVHFADQAAIATGAVLWAAGVVLLLLVDRVDVRFPLLIGLVGGVGLIVGPAVTSGESEAVATIGGLATALVLVALGTVPGRVLLSLIGSVGLLVYVPWSISHFFPGEDRAPLLIAASGAVIVVVAVMLARSAGRMRAELGGGAPG